ncbi:MAG: succinate dehydrogenase, cytochrome b556 subunit [Anaerolineae bacterium]
MDAENRNLRTERTRSWLTGAVKWFDPRSRQVGTWAFSLNRITALGLTLYLFMHLLVLSQLASGPAGYNSFTALAKSPLFLMGEFLVVAAGIIHGLNGLRIALTSFGIAVPYQKQLLYILMAIALGVCLYFAFKMFAA